ncbi:hypothetical protein EUX98_g6104 [Antrodiella citrinella]|uniref:Uncharacterized protein n=1 Tax=Antrodiella citrinella TaxID=2447956 RepID=A0A4S4MSF7_9APHY|nr:hypothetical protein EUX98_g6104 [Antrodiella citrinella]
MAVVSLAPLAALIVCELPSLIERTLKYNVENNIIENQLVVLQSKIDNTKKNIAAERKTQRDLREKIKAIRGDRRVERSSIFSLSDEVPFGSTSIPSIRAQPDQSMVSQSTATSQSMVLFESPVSLRTKRKGIVFSDDIRIVKKVKLAGREFTVDKENYPDA